MEYLIENSLVVIGFDSDLNAITKLYYKRNDQNAIKVIVPDSLFQLGCYRESEKAIETYYPGEFDKVTIMNGESTQTMLIDYASVQRDNQELPVFVQVSISLGDETESTWEIEIRNQSATDKFDIVEVLFPYLRGIYLGETYEDDVIVFPHHAGEKTLAPAQVYRSERYQGFFRAESRYEEGCWSREINYCGLASMMWMYYYDDQNGIYFGSHDKEFLVTGLRVESGGEAPDSFWMGFAFRKYQRIRPGKNWRSNPYIIAYQQNDWHWGAKRYRKWFSSIEAIEAYTGYLDQEITLNQCYNLKRGGQVFHRYEDIPKIFETGLNKFNARHLFLASWNRSGFDRDYPEFQPDLELGTPLDLAQSCDDVKDQDGFITFYINARIFHLESDFHKTLGQQWGIKKANDKLHFEQYGVERFSVNCPSHNAWKKVILGYAEWMIRAYGARGVYLDQLGSAEPFACFDKNHSHDDIGLFNQGYVEILGTLRERISKINPHSFIMIENCGDIYGNHVWGNLTWNGEDYDEFYELYKYTFPEFLQVHMVNPLVTLPEEIRWEKFLARFIRAILLGAVFWLGIDKFDNTDQTYIDFAHRAISLRRELNPFYLNGRYVDVDNVQNIPQGIKIAHWVEKDGSHLFIFGNSERTKDKIVNLCLPGFQLSSLSYGDIDQSGKPIKVEQQNDGTWTVEVPENSISYIHLSAN